MKRSRFTTSPHHTLQEAACLYDRQWSGRCCQCCEMLLLCWSVLSLLCLRIGAESSAVRREPGENVTLECSLAGCTHDAAGYVGMYLYHYLRGQEEVLYYHSMNRDEKISARERYKNRVQTEGSLKNHTITISNVSEHDSGVYSCIYKKAPTDETRCNVYTLAVGRADLHPSPPSPEGPTVSPSSTDVCSPLVLVTTTAVLASLLLTLIVITIFVPKVKLWTSSRNRARTDPLDPSNCVYEVMTKRDLQPSPSPYHAA